MDRGATVNISTVAERGHGSYTDCLIHPGRQHAMARISDLFSLDALSIVSVCARDRLGPGLEGEGREKMPNFEDADLKRTALEIALLLPQDARAADQVLHFARKLNPLRAG